MKRLAGNSSAMISICPNTSDGDIDQINNDPLYARSDFETMLDGSSHVIPAEKKKRLSVSQVKALENNFEVENKLEPERKVKLAQELGLQPRQVAVWFQNRRARYKTKRLERDYGALEANYDGLKLNYEKLQRENEALLKEIIELKAKLDYGKSQLLAAKADAIDDEKPNLETQHENDLKCEEETIASEATVMNIENLNNDTGDDNTLLCDSDSSAILNEDANINNSPNATVSSSSYQFLDMQTSSLPLSKASGVSVNGDNTVQVHMDRENGNYDYQLVKIEEHDLFNGHDEESCVDLFSEDQAPSLPWICSEDWN